MQHDSLTESPKEQTKTLHEVIRGPSKVVNYKANILAKFLMEKPLVVNMQILRNKNHGGFKLR